MEKIKALIKTMQEKGIPVLFVRDPKTKEPSVSLTMVVVSFGLCVIGIIGKMGGYWQIDINQSLNLLSISSALYWGRKFSSGDKTVESPELPKN